MIESTYRKGNKVLQIHYDETPESPREWSNLGIMAFAEQLNTTYGDEQYDEETVNAAYHSCPVYIYQHSSVAFSIHRTYPFDDRWDAGQIGYIYTTQEKIKEIYGDKMPTKEEIEQQFEGEVKDYTQYCNGEVYGFTLSTAVQCNQGEEHLIEEDSCWGYYDTESILSEHGFTEADEE